MRQLTLMSPGRLEWVDVPEPTLESPAAALVQPVAAGVCDYDRFLIRGISALPGAIALGHEFVARVLRIGDDVTAVRPGDLAIVPYHITCGTCVNCRRGHSVRCQSVPPLSVYGFGQACGPWGGMYSDVLRVPYADAMLVPVPAGLRPERIAACGDNATVAWCTVAPTVLETKEAAVLVVGGGMASTGLFAAAAAVALGAAQVDYLDGHPDRLSRARAVGARPIEGSLADRYGPYTLSVDASMTADGLACALRSTEPEGLCRSVCLHFDPVPVPLFDMYTTRSTLKLGMEPVRAAIPSVLDLIVAGRLQPEAIISRVVPWDDAIDALMEGTPSKLILRREKDHGPRAPGEAVQHEELP